MEQRNVAWCRRILSGIVNFNVGQTDQDFNTDNDAYYHLDDALTEAYDLEVNEAKAKASSEAFKQTMQFTWSSGTVTLELPLLDPEDLLELYDVTDLASGRMLIVGRRSQGSQVFWLNKTTLQWANTGPDDDKTIEATYLASPQELKKAVTEPDLIPHRFRHLLPWSAACILSTKADQNPPSKWEDSRKEWRSSWYSAIGRGKPAYQNVPRVRNHRRRAYGR